MASAGPLLAAMVDPKTFGPRKGWPEEGLLGFTAA